MAAPEPPPQYNEQNTVSAENLAETTPSPPAEIEEVQCPRKVRPKLPPSPRFCGHFILQTLFPQIKFDRRTRGRARPPTYPSADRNRKQNKLPTYKTKLALFRNLSTCHIATHDGHESWSGFMFIFYGTLPLDAIISDSVTATEYSNTR